jgi:uncharacterized protein (TIGR04255 family)
VAISGTGPHYKYPPVIEVVCGIQFSGMEEWRTPHFGSFWEQIRAEYPEFEDRAPLDRIQLESGGSVAPQIVPLPPLRRVFFIQPPGNFLIQLQQSRILHNWRKVAPNDEYPRYETAYPRFVKSWERLKRFAASSGLSEPQAEIFELTYINQITKDGATFPRDAWDFLAFYGAAPNAAVASDSTSIAMNFSWHLPNEMGRLIFDLRHGLRPTDSQQVLQIELSARGKANQGESSMTPWFQIAHDAIVNTFDILTSESAHTLWEKIS